jgi:hypothetical protein
MMGVGFSLFSKAPNIAEPKTEKGFFHHNLCGMRYFQVLAQRHVFQLAKHGHEVFKT